MKGVWQDQQHLSYEAGHGKALVSLIATDEQGVCVSRCRIAVLHGGAWWSNEARHEVLYKGPSTPKASVNPGVGNSNKSVIVSNQCSSWSRMRTRCERKNAHPKAEECWHNGHDCLECAAASSENAPKMNEEECNIHAGGSCNGALCRGKASVGRVDFVSWAGAHRLESGGERRLNEVCCELARDISQLPPFKTAVQEIRSRPTNLQHISSLFRPRFSAGSRTCTTWKHGAHTARRAETVTKTATRYDMKDATMCSWALKSGKDPKAPRAMKTATATNHASPLSQSGTSRPS